MFLNEIKIGQKCKIKKINTKNDIKRRLMDMGMIENTIVECVLQSPFKEPKAYLIRGAIISLRKDDCKNIEVELI